MYRKIIELCLPIDLYLNKYKIREISITIYLLYSYINM